MAGSSFWLGEYDLDTISGEPEAAVADSILGLGYRQSGERSSRLLEVIKLRGSNYLSGRHAYRISAAGLSVFPRLADTVDASNYDLGAERVSTGIDALDDMLTDGYWPGSSTLCAGPSGIGKTLMGLHFIVAGAAAGEPGIIASLQENPTQLTRIARAFGWTLDDSVTMMYRSPVDLYVDEWIYELLDAIDRLGAKRVLIDSLTDVLFASGDEIRFREYMYSLIQRCSRTGVSLFMTTELPDLFAVNRLSEYGVSHLSDNVLILQYIRDESTIRRADHRAQDTRQQQRSSSPRISHRIRRHHHRRDGRPITDKPLLRAGARPGGGKRRQGLPRSRNASSHDVMAHAPFMGWLA